MTKAAVNKEATFKEVGYEPHPAQRLFHDSPARFKIACCGRRFGKSLMAGHEVTAAMFRPDTIYWICGPTYKLGEKEFRVVFDDFFRKMPFANDRRFKKAYNLDQGNMRIETPWNSKVEVVSADKQDSLVGEGLDGVVMSEAALHKPDTWQMYIQPALTDKRGWAIFPSTPRGHNWYETMYMMGLDPQFEDWASWRFPTWANTASFSGESDPELVAIRQNASDFHWLQEYRAEFTALEGKIYDEFRREVHITDIKYNPFWANYQGWDHGFADPTVCLDIMIDSMDNVYVWREYQVRRKTTTEHCLAIIARDNPSGYHVDGRFGGTADANENAIVGTMLGPVIARVTPWIHGIEAVKRAMKIQNDGKPKFYIDRSCKETIRQVENLRTPDEKYEKNMRRSTGAGVAREGQHDYDDHGADALRYFFNEKFVWGYHAGSLDAVYDAQPARSQAEGVLSYHTQLLNLPGKISYGPQI